MTMHKTAIAFALPREINLGRYENGYYYIADGKALPDYISIYPTACSAVTMMRHYMANKIRG